jgi:hypothetical protein
MKCFNHPDADAVAICKYCSKALCRQCAQDTDHGVICSASCKQEVDSIDEMMKKSKQIYPLAAKAGFRNAIWYLLVALVFITLGVVTKVNFLSVFLIGLGVLFIMMAALTFLNSRKMSRLAKGDVAKAI